MSIINKVSSLLHVYSLHSRLYYLTILDRVTKREKARTCQTILRASPRNPEPSVVEVYMYANEEVVMACVKYEGVS